MQVNDSTAQQPKQRHLCDFNTRPIWVAFSGEPKPTDDDPEKIDKAPLSPRTGRAASNTDATAWDTRSKAEIRKTKLAEKNPLWRPGIGIQLGPIDGVHIAGIDLDGCRDPATGKVEHWARAIIERFASYAEVSPSGEGIKVFFLIDPKSIAAVRKAMGTDHRKVWSRGSHHGVELHVSHSYYTVTGNQLDADALILQLVGPNDDLRIVPLSDLLWLINTAGPHCANGAKGKARDESRSGALFRLAEKIKQQGGTREDFDAAIDADDAAAAHVAKDGVRAADRAWANSRDAETFADADLEGDNALAGFGFDENGVIEAFTERYTGKLKFDHHAGAWFKFVGTHWQREGTKLAQHYARETSLELARQEPGSTAVRALKKVSVWEAIERGARADRAFAVTSEVWNRDKMLLGTPGGTVDLRTGELRSGVPEDHISRVTAIAPIPLDQFDAQKHCPTWLAFLAQALDSDADAIRFLQQWGGYSLTGETKEQVLTFVYGPGGSGKGTAINTIAEIMGNYAVNVGMETLTASKHDRHTTELARLHGARMARASETEKGRAWAENRIKTMTGQDTITARFMRQDDFEFLPEFKLTIFGNNRPSLKDVDAAIKRRFMVLPFDHPPAQKDAELPARLRVEWPGILSWLVQGCLDWQANGLVRPSVVAAATDAYFAEQDTFGQWLDEDCETGKGFAATTDALWQSWCRFAQRVGEDAGSKTKTFPETLSQRGFVTARNTSGIRGRGFAGLRVRAETFDGEGLDV